MKSYLVELNEGFGLFRFRHDSGHLSEDEIEYLEYCNLTTFRQEDIRAGDIILYETFIQGSGIRISSNCIYMSRQVAN
jgi:hypothetical protein